MKKKDRAKGVKAWAKALALAAFALVPFVAEAGFTHSQTIGTTSRRKLEGNTVYLVTSDLEIRASSGFSAFSMDANSTSVLYVATGKTLTLQGGNASGTTGAGAGIEIPSSSLLIITGGGTINATGGKGAIEVQTAWWGRGIAGRGAWCGRGVAWRGVTRCGVVWYGRACYGLWCGVA